MGGEERRVDYKAMQVLTCLAESPGEEVPKERIFDTVWSGTAVTDDVLTGAVSTLRRALGDDARSPRFIQTIPRVGYRLIAPVRTGASTIPRRRRWPLAAAVLVTALVVIAVARWPAADAPPPSPPRSLAVLPLANFTGDAEQELLADGTAMRCCLTGGLTAPRTCDPPTSSETAPLRHPYLCPEWYEHPLI